MAQDQVALKGFGIFGGNLDRCQFAKPGIDPVNRILAFGSGTDHVAGGLDTGLCRRIKFDGNLVAPDIFKIGKRCCGGRQGYGHFASLSNTGCGAFRLSYSALRATVSPPKIRSNSGLNPMR